MISPNTINDRFGKIERPYPWERGKMTICIAGICSHKNQHAIVCIADTQATYGDFIKSEGQLKMVPVGRGNVLISGDPSNAAELVSLIKPSLMDFDTSDKTEADFDLRITKLLSGLREAVRKRKAEITNHYIAMKYNISFADFLANGSKWFPLDTYANILNEIQYIRLGCEIIFAYAADSEPVIIEITQDGKVNWGEESYICVGSGSSIALSILCQKPWLNLTLPECMTRLLMAKRAAEKDPHVGGQVVWEVLVHDLGNCNISDEGIDYIGDRAAYIDFPDDHGKFKDSFVLPIGGARGKAVASVRSIPAAAKAEPSSRGQAS